MPMSPHSRQVADPVNPVSPGSALMCCLERVQGLLFQVIQTTHASLFSNRIPKSVDLDGMGGKVVKILEE